MLYLDTSAFLKLVVDEDHSGALRRAVAGADLWSSTVLAVEAHRAARRLAIGPAPIDLALEAVTLVVPDETTFARARTIGPDELRTLDALHLAAMAELGGDLEAAVTYDRRRAAGCDDAAIALLAPGLTPGWWRGDDGRS